MRDYFRRASELHDVRRGFMLIPLAVEPRRSLFGFRRPRSHKGFTVKDGKLHVRGEELRGGPMRILEAFANAQGEGLDLSEELKRAIRERTEAIDRAFRSSREATRPLLRLLERRGPVGPAPRARAETGGLRPPPPPRAPPTFLLRHHSFPNCPVDGPTP